MPSLNYTLRFQERLNWCWAAVTVAIDRFYNPASTLTQCQLVNLELGRGDCCTFWVPWHPCNVSSQLSWPLARVRHLRYGVSRPATWAQVTTEIDRGNPFCIGVDWYLACGHFMVCSGYYQTAVGNYMLIKDPAFGVSLVPYAIFPKGYWVSLGSWTETYFTN